MALAALFFAVMGAVALVNPTYVSTQFGIPALTPDGRNEVRAVYGGFGVAMAVALVAARFTPSLRVGICMTLAAALVGMAVGRLVSAAIDRRLGAAPRRYLALEILIAALLWFGASGA